MKMQTSSPLASSHRQTAQPSRIIPIRRPKVTDAPYFAEMDLHATGADKAGRFSQLIQKPLYHGCWITSARGTTHSDRFHFSMTVRGPYEKIEHLMVAAENDPLFPKSRPAFTISREPSDSAKKCSRHEIFAEAADDAQIAIITALAGKWRINIAWMEMRRIDAPFSGQIVTAEFLCSEIMLDVQNDQCSQFSQFKAALVELLDDDQLIRLWGPILEDQPGERPCWKSERCRI